MFMRRFTSEQATQTRVLQLLLLKIYKPAPQSEVWIDPQYE